MDKVFEAIREKRLELGVSQGELSARMGKPQSSIARLESGGVRDPRISMFFQASKALRINPGEILGWAFDQVEGHSDQQSEVEDWRIQGIKNKLDLLDPEKREQIAEIIERILKLI
jgi:transcriptional regulator with XRE-family HTH domain